MIGIGCMVYLACSSKLLGAVLFSAGLFFVLTFRGVLFTGICGLPTPWRKLLAVYLLNGLGILLAGSLTWTGKAIPTAAAAVVTGKLNASPLSWLTNGLLCGVMMYLAVTGFKQSENPVHGLASVLYGVPVFILAFFEHSIADMGYVAMALPHLTMLQVGQSLLMVLVVTVGNVLGSKLVYWLTTPSKNP